MNRPPSAARAMAEKHGFSLRTAYRHLQRGVEPLPADCYRIGADDKRYPAFPRAGRMESPLHTPLAIARSNLRRVARAERFYDADLDILRDIAALACDLLASWESMSVGIKHQLTQPPATAPASRSPRR